MEYQHLFLEVEQGKAFCVPSVLLCVEEYMGTVEVQSLVSTSFQQHLQPANLEQHHPDVLISNENIVRKHEILIKLHKYLCQQAFQAFNVILSRVQFTSWSK